MAETSKIQVFGGLEDSFLFLENLGDSGRLSEERLLVISLSEELACDLCWPFGLRPLPPILPRIHHAPVVRVFVLR